MVHRQVSRDGSGLVALLERLGQLGRQPGKRREFESLLRRLRPFLIKLAKCYASEQDLEDLVQEGLEGLMYSLEHYEPSRRSSFAAFALPHLKGRMRHYVRRERRHTPFAGGKSACREANPLETLEEKGAWRVGEPSPARLFSQPEAETFVAACMSRLSPAERRLLVIYLREGGNLSAVARRLKLSRSTLQLRLRRVKGLLAEVLQPVHASPERTRNRIRLTVEVPLKKGLRLGLLFLMGRPEVPVQRAWRAWLRQVDESLRRVMPPVTRFRRAGPDRLCVLWPFALKELEPLFDTTVSEALQQVEGPLKEAAFALGKATSGQHGETLEAVLGHALATAVPLHAKK